MTLCEEVSIASSCSFPSYLLTYLLFIVFCQLAFATTTSQCQFQWRLVHLLPQGVVTDETEFACRGRTSSIAPFTVIHSKRSGVDHTVLPKILDSLRDYLISLVLPANNTTPAFPSWAFTRCHHHSNWGSRHLIAAHYSFIDPERMKGIGYTGLNGWNSLHHPRSSKLSNDLAVNLSPA